MSAVNSVKLKSNCNAVSSGSFINQTVVNSSIVEKSQPSITTLLINNNNGTNLNNQSSIRNNLKSPESSSDVQKVLKQEQELQKQLYSGSNVAPGWLRVNHNNKVIYIRWESKKIIPPWDCDQLHNFLKNVRWIFLSHVLQHIPN